MQSLHGAAAANIESFKLNDAISTKQVPFAKRQARMQQQHKAWLHQLIAQMVMLQPTSLACSSMSGKLSDEASVWHRSGYEGSRQIESLGQTHQNSQAEVSQQLETYGIRTTCIQASTLNVVSASTNIQCAGRLDRYTALALWARRMAGPCTRHKELCKHKPRSWKG